MNNIGSQDQLLKIAQSEDMTYLQKTASIVDLYATGVISDVEADAAATDMGIALADLTNVYEANYGDNIEKTAQEAAQEATHEATPLEKTAAIADHIAAGDFENEDHLIKVASENNVPLSDVEAIYNMAYGDELQKTAALDEAGEILSSQNSSPLEKTAALADLALQEVLTPEETADIAAQVGVDANDIATMITNA